jgi:hypothetical protein
VSDETIFLVANYSVVPFWLLLAVAPRWRWTDRLACSALPAVYLVPLYAWLLFGDDPGPRGASFFTLEGVTRIFTTPRTIIACWIHYLVFDLFVGAWEVRDARRLGIRHFFVVPFLALTLMFGPIGWLGYAGLRLALRRRFLLDETA